MADQPAYAITARTDFTQVLAHARTQRGWTCEELDARAGWADRYAAKLEHPDTKSGRKGLQLSEMGEVWMIALGYCLALVPIEAAERLGLLTFNKERVAQAFRPDPVPVEAPPRARRVRPVLTLRRNIRNG